MLDRGYYMYVQGPAVPVTRQKGPLTKENGRNQPLLKSMHARQHARRLSASATDLYRTSCPPPGHPLLTGCYQSGQTWTQRNAQEERESQQQCEHTLELTD